MKKKQKLTSGPQAMYEHGAFFLISGIEPANEAALQLATQRKETWAFVNRNGMLYMCYDPQPISIAG